MNHYTTSVHEHPLGLHLAFNASYLLVRCLQFYNYRVRQCPDMRAGCARHDYHVISDSGKLFNIDAANGLPFHVFQCRDGYLCELFTFQLSPSDFSHSSVL